jgi:hypothetical protein
MFGNKATEGSKQKIFYAWRNLYLENLRNNDLKIESLKILKAFGDKEGLYDVKRAFSKWKDIKNDIEIRETTINRRLIKAYIGKLNKAFQNWRNQTVELRERVRYQLLAEDLANQQYLQKLFTEFKLACESKKQSSHYSKERIFKAWRDEINRQKQIRKTALAVLKLDATKDENLLKLCFDAFRLGKQ